MKKAIIVCFCLIVFPAFAEPVRIDLSPKDCHRLLDDSAAYVPGVSTTRKAVVPADLNQSADIPLPDLDNMTFPVYLDLEQNFPLWKEKGQRGFAPVGQVEFKDGDVFVNGTLVSKNKLNAVKQVCREKMKNIDKNNLINVQ